MIPFMLKMNNFLGVKGCEGKHLVGCVIYENGHKGITLPKKQNVNITKMQLDIIQSNPTPFQGMGIAL